MSDSGVAGLSGGEGEVGDIVGGLEREWNSATPPCLNRARRNLDQIGEGFCSAGLGDEGEDHFALDAAGDGLDAARAFPPSDPVSVRGLADHAAWLVGAERDGSGGEFVRSGDVGRGVGDGCHGVSVPLLWRVARFFRI